jgi:hypothetical protein
MNHARISRLEEILRPASSPTITAVTLSSTDNSVLQVLYSDGVSKVPSQMTLEELAKLKGPEVSYKVYFDIGPDDL